MARLWVRRLGEAPRQRRLVLVVGGAQAEVRHGRPQRRQPQLSDEQLHRLQRRLGQAEALAQRAQDGEATVHPHAYNGYLAVVAHNHTKPAMKKFVEENVDVVSLFPIVTTRSTGTVLEESFGLTVNHKTCSGPLGGDQEIGGMISLGELDGVLFFRDPLSAHPHDDDIKALMRICDVHCIPTANNPASGKAVLFYLASLAAHSSGRLISSQGDVPVAVSYTHLTLPTKA